MSESKPASEPVYWIERMPFGPRHGSCWAVWGPGELSAKQVLHTSRTKREALRMMALAESAASRGPT